MTSHILARIIVFITNRFKHIFSTNTRDNLFLDVYHTPWLAIKDRYPWPSSTSYCSKLLRREKRYAYERHLIPLLRIRTVIYSDLVDLSHLTVQLETQSGLGANDQALSPGSRTISQPSQLRILCSALVAENSLHVWCSPFVAKPKVGSMIFHDLVIHFFWEINGAL